MVFMEQYTGREIMENTYSLSHLLTALVKNGGSDLHLTVGLPPTLRVHGSLVKMNLPALNPADIKRLMGEVLSDKQRIKIEETMELDCAYEIEGLARFRVNAFYNRLGMAGVFRVIPTKIMTLTELGLPPYLEKLANKNNGLVLVTGPTGSGKSTTLAAIVHKVNQIRYDHILTIEDPIEFVHKPINCIVNQRELGTNTLSFTNALRSALREDPDIILVGELRDYETISLAITAAETGHLVFGTLHTNSAAATIDRIIDVFPPHQQSQIRTQLAETIQAVIAQQLIPKKNGKGRVAALEIMMGSYAVKSLIREGKTFQLGTVIQTSTKEGMMLLDQSLKDLVKKGLIDAREGFHRAIDKKTFAEYVKRGL